MPRRGVRDRSKRFRRNRPTGHTARQRTLFRSEPTIHRRCDITVARCMVDRNVHPRSGRSFRFCV